MQPMTGRDCSEKKTHKADHEMEIWFFFVSFQYTSWTKGSNNTIVHQWNRSCIDVTPWTHLDFPEALKFTNRAKTPPLMLV